MTSLIIINSNYYDSFRSPNFYHNCTKHYAVVGLTIAGYSKSDYGDDSEDHSGGGNVHYGGYRGGHRRPQIHCK